MAQSAILPVKPMPSRSEKAAPEAQELRSRFAQIKRELRRIRRLISRQSATSKPRSNAKE